MTLDFHPSSSQGAPWSWSNADPKGNQGETKTLKKEVKCECKECTLSYWHGCYVHCTINLKQHIFINKHYERKKDGIYGHEQQHITSLQCEVTKLGKKLAESLKDTGCTHACETYKKAYMNDGQPKLNEEATAEADPEHRTNPLTPTPPTQGYKPNPATVPQPTDPPKE